MQLKLYYAPIACSMVPWINLTEAGATFETIALNMKTGEHLKPDYLAINPKHKVPMLVIDGERLTENVAIQIWIARNFPAAKLLPADPMAELQAISLMGWFGSGMHPHMTRIFSPGKFCDVPGTADSVRRLAGEQLIDQFKIAEDKLAGREYFLDQFTAADPYFYWCFRRAIQFELPLSPFVNCMAHMKRMEERPSVKALLAYEADTMKKFAA
jgi:glutathione S-transferase